MESASFILVLTWQVLSCCFVDGVITKKSNSMTTLEDFKIKTRTKRATNGLSSAQQTESVDKHNELRSAEQAADMKFMVTFYYLIMLSWYNHNNNNSNDINKKLPCSSSGLITSKGWTI